ncbi:DUF4345 domain-containing protein [Vibrio cholerae]|nr:DUF4345 domain-containing protein [Vibrio cholerae]
MTSNSPESDNSFPARTGRPSGSDPTRPGAASGVAGPGTTPGVSSRDTGQAASQRPGGTTAGDSASGASKGAPAVAKGTTTGKAKGRKPGKSATQGGDWNVFRTVVVLVGVVIAGFGAYYLILGTAGLPDTEANPVNPTLESQFRFFSAMMVGVGAAFITIAIKFQWANMLWLVCLMVFVGGIGRVLSWAFSGTPNYIMIILMVIELAFPPALLVWHKYIAKTSEMRQEFAQRD